MNKIEISVIIPIYNVEKYVEKCINSVINQSFQNIEIIIINDGTKDNSMKIIEKYLIDERIKIINKENGGLSSARNKGLEEAKGKYVYFLDSDDWIEKDAIELLYKNCSDEDIIFSNFSYYNEKTKKKKININKYKFLIGDLEGKYFLVNNQGINAWNKLYKISFLKENNLKFLENIIYEDLEFNFRCFFLSKNVKYIDENKYNYRISREGSIMSNSKIEESIFSLENIIKSLSLFSKKSSLDKFSKDRLTIEIEKLKIWRAKLINKKILKNEYRKIDKIIKQIYNNNWNEIEKEIFRIEIGSLIDYSNVIGIHLSDKFYWKNKIFSFRILRRILERKIVEVILRRKNGNK